MASALSQMLIHRYKKGMNIPVEAIGNLTASMAFGKIFTPSQKRKEGNNV